MINGNRIQFGYGDIGVNAGFLGNIELQQFKPTQECGSHVYYNAVEWIGERISVGSGYSDLVKLKSHLMQVKEQKCFEFEFDGYVFDFTNYNVESILVCLKTVEKSIRFTIRLMAC
jgi:hypothetical protein